MDPEETGSLATAPYESEVAGPSPKRPRTIDDVLGSLSLRPPDPPGKFACKRKNHDRMDEDERTAKKMANPEGASSLSPSADGSANDFAHGNSADGRLPEPEGRKGGSPTHVASDIMAQPTQQSTSYVGQDSFRENSASDSIHSKANHNNNDVNNSSEMPIDDSDHESDGSVSEGSIKNAMYQLVFGRKNLEPPGGSGGGIGPGRYDAVDSKIEDLIRRSRLQAAVKSHKEEKKEDSAMDMEMEGDNCKANELSGDDCWIPGHG